MLNVLELSARFKDEWVVMDKLHNVIDHGPDLAELWRRHEEGASRLTFYFASPFLPNL